MRRGVVMRTVHRVHRWLGTALALLIGAWFASGAVMVFARYPSYTTQERLANAPPLQAAPTDQRHRAPSALVHWLEQGPSAQGDRARLAMLEGRATWTFTDEHGIRRAVSAASDETLAQLTAARASAEAAHKLRRRVTHTTKLEVADQWTVGRVPAAFYPLFRVALADERGREAYVSSRSGELLQESTRMERVWCWLGAIPHWVYPAVLRRERELWRTSVLWLSGIGLGLTLTGLTAGLHADRLSRKRAARSGSPRNVYLRWHQRLGLGFGVLASTWLLSGALSLSPFHWSGPGPGPAALAHLHGRPASVGDALQPLSAAWDRCREELAARELELYTFGGHVHVACVSRSERRTIDLADPTLTPQRYVAADAVTRIATQLAAPHARQVTWTDAPDDYHYPTHSQPDFTLPYVRIDLSDAEATTYYLDPARGELVNHVTRAKRAERWLYNGLHSLDVAWLYRRRLLWQSVMVLAMLVGVALTALGVAVPVTRWGRQWQRQRRRRPPGRPSGMLDTRP